MAMLVDGYSYLFYYKQCVVRLQMFDQITSFQLLTLSEVMVLYYMITNTDLIGFQELS